MAANKVALVVGAGRNIGQHVSAALANRGYRVATASRSAQLAAALPGSGPHHHFQVDASDPAAVASLVSSAAAALGSTPSVVIYNAYSVTLEPADDPLSKPDIVNVAIKDTYVNTFSVLSAAQAAVEGWKAAGIEDGTFIFTGNAMNQAPLPSLLTFGMGKTATAYLIRGLTLAYKASGKHYKFYYTDERTAEGGLVNSKINGAAAAEAYLQLVENPQQQEWDYTFVKGKGYHKF